MKPEILLRSGRYFNLARPNPDDVDIADIAHALSRICRFTGHVTTIENYSVAQHSVLVSHLVPPQFALQGLLHDAPEAYIGDISAPLKRMLPDYQAIERRVEQSVFEKFGLPLELDATVKYADLVMLSTEKRDMMPATAEPWPCELTHPAMSERIRPLPPRQAELVFLARFSVLMRKRNADAA